MTIPTPVLPKIILGLMGLLLLLIIVMAHYLVGEMTDTTTYVAN